MKFYQEPPEISNFYRTHQLLRQYLNIYLDDQDFNRVDKELDAFGQRVVDEIDDLGKKAEKEEPKLVNYDTWGKRIDEIQISDSWTRLKEIAAEEGLIAIGYLREYQENSRLVQMAKLLLYTPSSAIYTCPLAMADGAARLIETLAPELETTFQHLISRNPSEFWVAGQWMTEREGGSDVSKSSTRAIKTEDNTYRLFGDKWFTSAATAEMAMTLARIEEDGEIVQGSRGLSLFYLQTHLEDGSLNGIEIHKLKDKLGTKALPTAELTLNETKAIQIGEKGRGVKHISTILNITRIYNAMSSVSYMARGYDLAKDYASKRSAFGKKLDELPLHQEVLIDIETEYTTSFLLTYYVVRLLGKVEKATNKETTEHKEEKFLRLLTPVVKLWTGKRVVSVVSEVIESIGGMGYIEETEIPQLFRNAQVFPIWEGTTNVLSLDLLRAINKEGGLHQLLDIIQEFDPSIIDNIEELDDQDTEKIADKYHKIVANVKNFIQNMGDTTRQDWERSARIFAFSIAELLISYLLLDFAVKIEDKKYRKRFSIIIIRWFNHFQRYHPRLSRYC